MNYKEDIVQACKLDTLVEALAYLTICEADRIKHQNLELSFKHLKLCFQELIIEFDNVQWKKKNESVKSVLSVIEGVDGIFLDKDSGNYFVAVEQHGRNIINAVLYLEDMYDLEISVRAHQGRSIISMFDGLEKIWLRSD